MGVTTNPIYASEAFFSMSFPAKGFQKNHVPFVDPTDAGKERDKLARFHPVVP
jgi:hypothetical protein